MGTKSDNDYLYVAPADAGSTTATLAVSQVSASISLPPGRYRLYLYATVPGYALLGTGPAVMPVSGAAAIAGFPIAGGAEEGLDLSEKTSSTTLNFILASVATGTLWIRGVK